MFSRFQVPLVLVLAAAARAGDGVQFAFPGAAVPLAFETASVAAVDVNGDGVLDILASDGAVAPPVASMVLAQSTGTGLDFGAAQFVNGLVSRPLISGDLDGDGDEDVATAVDHSFEWLPNVPGGFLPKQTKLFTPLASCLATTDADGDGDLDIVLGNSSLPAKGVFGLMNDGSGLFTLKGVTLDGTNVDHVVAGDVDGDGVADCVVSNAFTIVVGHGLGTGGYSVGADYPVSFVVDLALGHFDSDGLVDLAWCSSNALASGVRLGLGGGAFGAAQPIAGLAASGLTELEAGDLDDDGDDDLAFLGGGNSFVIQMAEAVGGAFSTSAAGSVPLDGSPKSFLMRDADGDGLTDMVAGLHDGVSIVRGVGVKAFHQSAIATIANLGSTQSVSADFTLDGRADLLLRVGGETRVVPGAAGVGFGAPIGSPLYIASTLWTPLAAGDFTGDGVPDAVAAIDPTGFADDGLATLRGIGNGVFAPQQTMVLAGAKVTHAAAGDLDLDGDLDFVASKGNQFLRALNGGTGAFAFATDNASSTLLQALAGDLDGDGLIDAVSTDGTGFEFRRNLGAGVFAPFNGFASSTSSRGLGDLDGDGGLEIVHSIPGWIEALKLQPGDVFTKLTDVQTSLVQTSVTGIAGVTDLDGDGHAEVLGYADKRLSLATADAAGALYPAGMSFIGLGVPSMLDANADGLADAITVHSSGIVNLSACGPANVPGPWSNVGFALVGSAGFPSLVGSGELVAGTPASIDLTHAAPLAPVAFVVGANAVMVPLKGGTLVPAPDAVVMLATDASGELHLAMNWPAGLPSGFDLYLQAWIQDAGGPSGFAASNGLRARTP